MDVFFCGGTPSGDENPEGEISCGGVQIFDLETTPMQKCSKSLIWVTQLLTPNLKAKRLRLGEVELMQGAKRVEVPILSFQICS